MATISFPAVTPTSVKWRIEHNVRKFTSEQNGNTQTLGVPGARWHVELLFQNMNDDTARTLQGWIASLKGGANRFYLHNHAFPNAKNGSIGTIRVDGASQTGNSLVYDGGVGGANFSPGDFFAINNELKIVTNSTTGPTDTVEFEPTIRTSPGDNDLIDYTSGEGIFLLLNPPDLSSIPGPAATLRLQAIEAFYS